LEENPVIYTEHDTNNNTLVIQPGGVFMLNKGGNFIIWIMWFIQSLMCWTFKAIPKKTTMYE